MDSKVYTPNAMYVIASEGEYKEKKNIENPHPHSSIRFVYIGGDLSYKTSWKQESGYLGFLKGGEASMHIKDLNTKLDKLQTLLSGMEQLIELLEAKDPLYQQLIDNYIQKAQVFNAFCKEIAAKYHKESYMISYALMYQQLVPKKGSHFDDFKKYRAKNLFEFTNLKNPITANVPMLANMYKSYFYYNQPTGMVASTEIQKMQDEAIALMKENSCTEVLHALNMQDFRPQEQIWRDKFTKELSFDTIYKNNDLWFSEIYDILGAYTATSPYHNMFGADVITALERTQIPEAYTMLAEAAFSITEQFNWNKAQTEIVDYLTEKSDKRLLKGSGKVAQIYALKNMKTGVQAPNLIITEHLGKLEKHNHKETIIKSEEFAQGNDNQTLIIFYQSGCGPCEDLMLQLPGNYQLLKDKGFRIISISADEDENVFKNSSNPFPWKDKYCDYKGKSGINFKNYGVVGTPTIYLVDKSGKIIKKMATLGEVLELIKK